jgi:WD40 repeat protein
MQTILRLLTIVAILAVSLTASAQKQYNVWYFGNTAGIDFNQSPPKLMLDGMATTSEGSSTVCDAITGKLLFYTNGMEVWDADHNRMPNGFGLNSNPSSTQAALIVHDPVDQNRYYIFTADIYPSTSGICYSIVDMTANGGKGDVIEKNTQLLSDAAEKLTALASIDEKSYWIIGRGMNSNRWYAWQLTTAGLNTIPVISRAGASIGGGASSAIGWLAMSPDGTKLAAANWGDGFYEFFDFNNATGVISNAISFSRGGSGVYGCAFSPDGTKVFFGENSEVAQYDISTWSTAAISSSRKAVGHSGSLTVSVRGGPDGNVYVRNNQFIDRITNPDSRNFIYEPAHFDLGAGNTGAIGLPNHPTLLTAGVGPRTLSASLTELDFGALNVCEEPDSTIILTNTGDAPLRIESASIDQNFEILNTDLPVTIMPGSSYTLRIISVANTNGTATVLTGTLTVVSNADAPLTPITISRGVIYPKKLRVEVVGPEQAAAGDTIEYTVRLVGQVPALTTALHFDLLHDNDLLSFIDVTGNNITINSTVGEAEQRQTISITPVIAGDLFIYRVKANVAAASSTELRAENIRIETPQSALAPECLATISDTSATFTISPGCGDDNFRALMRDEQNAIRISPNPARDVVRLELPSDVQSITLIDAMGREVLGSVAREELDVRSLPVGAYVLQIKTAVGLINASLVIRR